MIIKYKGHTSKLLSDLSLQLGNTVDLKTSEKKLKRFFYSLFKETSAEQRIQIVSCLPAYIKPFCHSEYEAPLIHPFETKKTFQVILQVLEKHASEEALLHIYACFPETRFQEEVKKQASMAA